MPAKRETAKSTAQRTCSLVSVSWADELLSDDATGVLTGKKSGTNMEADAKCCCCAATSLSRISMDRTAEETARTTSDISAAVANLKKAENRIWFTFCNNPYFCIKFEYHGHCTLVVKFSKAIKKGKVRAANLASLSVKRQGAIVKKEKKRKISWTPFFGAFTPVTIECPPASVSRNAGK